MVVSMHTGSQVSTSPHQSDKVVENSRFKARDVGAESVDDASAGTLPSAAAAVTLSPDGTASHKVLDEKPAPPSNVEEEEGAEQAATALLSMFSAAPATQGRDAQSSGGRGKTQYWRPYKHDDNPRGYALILSRQNFPHRITLPLRSPGDVGSALFGPNWIREVRELSDELSSKSRDAVIVDGSHKENVTYILYHNTPGKPVYLSRLSGLFRRNGLVIGDVLAFWPISPGVCGLAVFKQGSKEAEAIAGPQVPFGLFTLEQSKGEENHGRKRGRTPDPGMAISPQPVRPKQEVANEKAATSIQKDAASAALTGGGHPGTAHVQAFIRDLERQRLAMVAANTSNRQSRDQKTLQTALVYNAALALQRQRQQQQQKVMLATGGHPVSVGGVTTGVNPQLAALAANGQAYRPVVLVPGAGVAQPQAVDVAGAKAATTQGTEQINKPQSAETEKNTPKQATMSPEAHRQMIALVMLQQKAQALLLGLRDQRVDLTPERSGALGACMETFNLLATLMLKPKEG